MIVQLADFTMSRQGVPFGLPSWESLARLVLGWGWVVLLCNYNEGNKI